MPVVEHAKLKEFEMMGNFITGLATPSRGAKTLEVWQAGWRRARPHHCTGTMPRKSS